VPSFYFFFIFYLFFIFSFFPSSPFYTIRQVIYIFPPPARPPRPHPVQGQEVRASDDARRRHLLVALDGCLDGLLARLLLKGKQAPARGA
jgi:hypothetical protein